MKFLVIVAIAIVIETLTEYLKRMLPELASHTWVVLLLTVVLGITAAIAFNADIFAELGFDSDIPLFGRVITGLLCAGGSNMIYDIISRIQGGGAEDE
ncbi:MAG: hypothetical protein IJU01_00535 [Lachnospiraceae bacterium]|nr:hypothetical protein [Lachnospiraceae bacterium]